MEVEKRNSKGGFLQLFEWNVKSRKKLFSNKLDLPESSKQGKENFDKSALTRPQQMKLHDGFHGPSLTESDWASSMSNNEGCGTKAPGVVARLMGLDSLPTLDASNPGSTPFIDSRPFRHSLHSRMTTEFESDHFADYGMRNKLDGFSRNPVEDRLQKFQNRPIERFQSEVLPPRSAKSVPITHHRMLSPIKSPGFVLSRNPSYIMEEASKIIEQSPQSTANGRLPSFASSSVPLRIRDLKEKMEAAQRTSRFSEASRQQSIMHSTVSSSKLLSRDNRQCQSEVVISRQGATGRSQLHKNNPVSLATPVKTNVQKGEGTPSRNRSTMKQKQDDVTSIRLDKKEKKTLKRVQNRTTTGRTPEVLSQNNQKQNRASNKDCSSLKPGIPYQDDRKTSLTKLSSREIKASKKAVENSAAGAIKASLVSSESGNELSSCKTKTTGKKRATVGGIISDGTNANNVLIKEKEGSVKCNVTVDGSSNWESIDRKNGMDVVSFTFTSPIKKLVSESETSGQPPVKSQGLRLQFQEDQPGTSEYPSFGTPMIDSDALGVLLEQKLKEISSLVETSQCDIVKGGSSPNSASMSDCLPGSDVAGSPSGRHDTVFHPNMQEKSINQCDFEVSLVDQMLVKEWQGAELTECYTDRSWIKDEYQLPEPSSSDVSSITCSSATTLTSNGNTHCISARNMELQDSATSLSNPVLEYIREVVSYAQLSLSPPRKVINNVLFNHLENQNKTINLLIRTQRKALFECASMCLEARRERAFSGSYEEWSKWSTMVEKTDALVDEIHREVGGWGSMEDWMVDEVVEKDMSSGEGNWLDFKMEGLEEGVVIERGIVSELMDEIVADFLSH